ncbi:MAG: type 4a pilus biogenesis protein PilO [Gammaproteobacteria bacterium]|jgi:Tfp pilus assembly protein PilO
MDALLEKIRPRTVMIGMVSVLLLVSGGAFAYVLVPAYKTYLKSEREQAALEMAVESGNALQKELVALRQDVEDLSRTLHGDMANLPEKELEAFILGRLQRISWENRIELVSVKPRKGAVVQTFRELLFDVEINGHYFDLFAWLQDLARELGFVVVKQYILRPLESGKESPRLSARLTIVSYRKA